MLITASMEKAAKGAWHRSNGVYPQNLRAGGTRPNRAWPSLAAGPARQSKADRRLIQELERELLRKEKALAETAVLLVLSKKAPGDLPPR